MDLFQPFFLTDLLAASVRLATPIGLAAVGEIYAERSGIFNLGLEGMMLAGAFTGATVALAAGNPWVGLLAAIAAGLVMALLHAFWSVTLKGDQIVSGLAINLLAFGLTTLFFRRIFGFQVPPTGPRIPVGQIPVLSDIPIIGPVFFAQSPLTYAMGGLALLTWFIFARTRWGLEIIATGDHPRAADVAGINVYRVRYICTLIAGMLAGAGGGFLPLAQLGAFTENMTGGRGFIALAAVIFGRWHPGVTLVGVSLFGLEPIPKPVQDVDLP